MHNIGCHKCSNMSKPPNSIPDTAKITYEGIYHMNYDTTWAQSPYTNTPMGKVHDSHKDTTMGADPDI